MKKLAVGFIAGAVFASSTVVYAGEAIKAVIFPVKYKVNGVNIDLPNGYQSINVDGRAYVPIRFAAESLNVVVAYDEASKTIQMDSGFDLSSINTPIRAGYIEVVKQGNTSKVKGKLYIGQSYWDALHNSKMEIKPGSEVDFKAGIAFYNDESKLLGVTPISMSLIAKGDQIKSFEIVTDQDVSGYTYASLQDIQPEPIYAFLPPSPFLDDPTGKVTIED